MVFDPALRSVQQWFRHSDLVWLLLACCLLMWPATQSADIESTAGVGLLLLFFFDVHDLA